MNDFEFIIDGRLKSSFAQNFNDTNGAFPSNGKLIEGAVRELFNERVKANNEE